ncbi:DNA-binding IclR family transcriptional regulator [Sphingomonas kyeonggiensis]|uniref:DNA-binding IclR family transcriptional regulator n=1 Tax=Sphingomonas kyeonggiensis TaxID=1268553 RepID=A0A7W7NSU9_9SPHN|nr:IclR family transcriptional regulator [Sphingomonas kyeonggiensis]MBB4840333.1 DNA-binding IclR family transcriptional regulator [Sphingomonas kyeonggiensis]
MPPKPASQNKPASKQAKPDDKSAAPNYSAPALEKGIDVIELLGNEPFGLTITEIAQRLGRSVSELFRVVVALDRRGWLHKDATNDRYRVTYKLLELAHRATPAQELTYVAAARMHSLAAETMQSCHLAVVNGSRGLIVARQESSGPTGFAVRLGTEIVLETSCSGHVLLAFMEEARRLEVLGTPPSRPLAERLAEVRAQGYESIESSRLAGVSDLSCPIFGFSGQVVAALTIPYLAVIDDAPHLSLEETLALLKVAAFDISTILGWYDREEAPVVPTLSVPEPKRPRRSRKAS